MFDGYMYVHARVPNYNYSYFLRLLLKEHAYKHKEIIPFSWNLFFKYISNLTEI